MKRLLVDTNIVLDLLQMREGFFEEAQELFTLGDNKKVSLLISSLTIANTHYLLSKHFTALEARKILAKFKVLAEVLPLDDKILELALYSDFQDFEDAIQYFTAIQYQAEMIITRNKKDFRQANIPILTAREYLESRQ